MKVNNLVNVAEKKHMQEMLYKMGDEEHEIWIKHNKELMPFYENDSQMSHKVAILGENFKRETEHLDKEYDETPAEYKRKIFNYISRNGWHHDRK